MAHKPDCMIHEHQPPGADGWHDCTCPVFNPPNQVLGDFDEFVKVHSIKDEEMGAAFAAWLSGSGWDGEFKEVQP